LLSGLIPYNDDAVPLGFRLPLVVRILPRLLRGDRQHGEIRADAADLSLLRVPHFPGHPEARASAPKASGCILGGTPPFTGRN
jgi:hypothetical protein